MTVLNLPARERKRRNWMMELRVGVKPVLSKV